MVKKPHLATSTRHFITSKRKKKGLKAFRDENLISYKRIIIELALDFLSETLDRWQYRQNCKGKLFEFRILFPVKTKIKCENIIKISENSVIYALWEVYSIKMSEIKNKIDIKDKNYNLVWEVEWLTKNVHALIPEICEYVILHGKRNFAGVIKVTNLKIGRFSSRLSLITWALKSRELSPYEAEEVREMCIMRRTQSTIVGLKKKKWCYESRNVGSF